MYKFLKYSSITIIFVIILLLVVPFFIPLDKYKEMATEKVKELTGRELEINGDISLSLLPSPGIKIKDIKLSSLDGAHYPSLFEAKEIKISLSHLSLLSGNISVSKIKINEPIVNLERMKNGSASWEFAKNTQNVKETQNEESLEKRKEDLLSLDISSFEILGAKINYFETDIDGSHKSNITIDNLEIKNFHGLDNLACEFYSTGTNYNISSNIQENGGIISLKINLDFLKEKIDLSGNFDRNNMSFIGKLKLEGDAQILKAITPSLNINTDLNHKLSFDINADQKLLKITDININPGELSAKGNSNYDIEKNKADLNLKLNPGNVDVILTPLDLSNKGFNEKISIIATSLEPIINVLKIKDLPSDIFSNPSSFSMDLSYLDQNLFLNNIVLNINKTNLNGSLRVKDWNKDLIIYYDLKTNDLTSFSKLLDVDLPININDIHIKGETVKVQDSYKTNSMLVVAKTTNIIKGDVIFGETIKPSLTFASSGNNLGQSLGMLLNSTPNTMLGNYSLATKIDGDLQKTIKIHIDKSSFSLKNNPLNIIGLLNLDLNNTKPKILVDLKIPSLNLGDSSSNDSSSGNLNNTKSRNAPPTQHRWSNDKIDLSFLNKADADITIVIQKFIKGELVFDSLKTVLLLSNGVLDLKSLNGNLYGGRLEASGQISSQNTQSAVFKASLKGADLKNIRPQGGKIKVTQGKVNFDADLKTKGQSQYQYVSNLFGTTRLTASNGKISGFDLQKVINSLKKVKILDTVLSTINNSFSGGKTAFKQLDVSTKIKEGVASITELKLDVPSVDISSTGNVNLPKYILDINSVVNVDIKSMPAIKVDTYGFLDNPQHKIDTRALQQYLIKNVLSNVINDIKKGTKPEDMLKNILGSTNNQENSSESQTDGQKNPTKILESQFKNGLKGLFK
ncbi:MAG: AsmA family protein [Rickettsiaceae bacterium]